MARLRLTRRKSTWVDSVKLDRSIRRSQRPGSGRPPASLYDHYEVVRRDINGFACYSVSPRSAGPQQVLYLHGGAYIHPIEPEHWSFVGHLAGELAATVHVPLYPLAPAHQCDETIAMVAEAYDRLVAPAEPTHQVVMGDSAGGGMTLILGQRLEEQRRPQPRHLVLISPWLDATMTNPAIAAVDRRDPYLSVPGLLEAGQMYAGKIDTGDPRISPINGELDGLGHLSVFAGTRDVLFPDARRLRTLALQRGLDLDYFEYEDMFHGWVLQKFLPESRRASAQIVDILRG